MRFKAFKIFTYLAFIAFLAPSAWAQGNKLFVTALDEKQQPVPKVEVVVDSFYAAVTKPDGKLIISMKTVDDPRHLQAVKNGYNFKGWVYDTTSREIVINLQRTGIIKGMVKSKKGNLPIPNVDVLLVNTEARPGRTNENGEFAIQLPPNISPNLPKKYAVYSFGLQSSDFEVYERDGRSIIALQQIPARPVIAVKILENGTGQPLEGKVLIADNKRNESDENGFVKLPYALTTKYEYRVDGYDVVNLTYDKEQQFLLVSVQQGLRNESDTVVVTTRTGEKLIIKVDEFESLMTARNEELSSERSRLTKEAEDIRKKLDDENITEAQRQLLLKRLDRITDDLTKNKVTSDSLSRLQAKVVDEVRNKLKLAQTQSDLAQKEKQALALKQKAQQAENQRNTLIFASVAIILLLLVIAFFIFNRRNRKQNKLLGEKVTEINRKNEMLEESKNILDRKNAQLKNQQQELERQHTKITDSIRYALTIQESILPAQEFIAEAFQDYFILYKPKDIVAGDFYWFAQKGGNAIISAIDCTGHGVPGGFMTMIGNTLLNQIVKEDNITDPKEILTQLNVKVKETLKEQVKDEGRDGDGMDLGLINFDMDNHLATFCGAKTPLFYVKSKDKELAYIKGTNISIGSTLSRKKKEFSSHAINFEKGDIFYLASDGFQDQLGGPSGGKQKFLKKKFISLIEEVSVLPMEEQAQKFEDALAGWQGESDQTDDIVILGLKV